MLLDHEVPLDSAVVLAADASGEPGLQRGAREIRDRISSGEVFTARDQIPRSFPPLIGWLLVAGSQRGELSGSLRSTAEMYRRRAAQAATWSARLSAHRIDRAGGWGGSPDVGFDHFRADNPSAVRAEVTITMSMFRYSAVDENGRPVSGEVEAATADDARRMLQQRGLDPRDVEQEEPKGIFRPAVMSADDAMEFAQAVAQVSGANLSLAMGLSAAADETGSRRVAGALKWLAARIEEGQTLQEALEGADRFVPRPVRGLILAASSTGRLSEALVELVELQRASSALRRGVLAALMYPALIGAFAAAVLLAISLLIGPTFEQMFSEFRVETSADDGSSLLVPERGIPARARAVCTAAAGSAALSLLCGPRQVAPALVFDAHLRSALVLAGGCRMERPVGGVVETSNAFAPGAAVGC